MKNIKLFAISALVLMTGFLLSGCQSFDGNSTMETAKGVKVEKLLSNDTFMVAKLGADNEDQFNAMMTLGGKFPQNPYTLMMDAIRGEIDDVHSGVSFTDDLLPVIGETPRLMFGFSIVNAEDDPEVVALVEVEDVEKAAVFMDKIIADDDGSKETYRNYQVYSAKEEDDYVGLYKDVMIMAPEKQTVLDAIDRGESNGKDTLLNNEGYQKVIDGAGDNLGYFFIDPSNVVTNMLAELDKEEVDESTKAELEDLEQMQDVVSMIKGELISFSAEDEGFRLKMRVYGDEEKMEEMGFPTGDDVMDSYLDQQLPGDDLIVYAESSNLKLSLEMMEKLYGSIEGFDQGIKQIKAAIQLMGLDYENELLPMVERGYAITMHKGDGVVPRVGLFIDAESNIAAAEKVLQMIDNGLKSMIVQSKAELGDAVQFESGERSKVMIDFALLPEEKKVDLPPFLQNYRGELHFGLKDNVLYLALYKGLTSGGFDVVANDNEYKKAIGLIPGYNKGVTFVNVTNLMDYVDQFMTAYFGDESVPSEYAMVQSYMKPVKSMVISGGTFENGMAEAEGFIRIE